MPTRRKGKTMMKDKGLLLVVSGPSGAGKGTICDALRHKFPQIRYSVSMTTRPPREGERDGINYFFADNAHFKELIKEDAFLEYADVYGHYYGTPKKYVFDRLEAGNHVMLEIDIQGAMQVREKYAEGVFIFIVPPSLDVLSKRLHKRHTDTEEVIAGRLAKASAELEWISRYDYVIVNDDLDAAINKAVAVISAEECKSWRNENLIASIKKMYEIK